MALELAERAKSRWAGGLPLHLEIMSNLKASMYVVGPAI